MLFEQKQQPHMWETESAKKAIIKCYLMNIESFCFKFEAHHESDRTWWEDEEKNLKFLKHSLSQPVVFWVSQIPKCATIFINYEIDIS